MVLPPSGRLHEEGLHALLLLAAAALVPSPRVGAEKILPKPERAAFAIADPSREARRQSGQLLSLSFRLQRCSFDRPL